MKAAQFLLLLALLNPRVILVCAAAKKTKQQREAQEFLEQFRSESAATREVPLRDEYGEYDTSVRSAGWTKRRSRNRSTRCATLRATWGKGRSTWIRASGPTSTGTSSEHCWVVTAYALIRAPFAREIW